MPKLPIKQQYEKLKANRMKLAGSISLLAEKHFRANFLNQGFDGKKWQNVQRRIKPTKRDIRTGASTRAILYGKKAGVLSKSIYGRVRSWDKIVIGTTVPYAKYHNEGTEKIPQRKFIGDSEILNKKIVNLITSQINKIFLK